MINSLIETNNTRNNNDIIMKIFILIFVFLYPIMPDYCVIFGQSVSNLLLVCVIVFNIIYNISRLSSIKIYYGSIVLLLIVFLMFIPYFIHYEIVSFLKYFMNYILLVWGIRLFINDKSFFEQIINTLLVACFILCLFGIIEFFTKFNIFSLIENFSYDNVQFGSLSDERMGFYRIESSFNTAITYCIYLMLCLCLCFYKFNKAGSRKRYVYLVLVLIININAFMTISRGPIIVFFFEEVLLTLLLDKNHKRLLIKWMCVLVVAVIIISIFFIPKILVFFNDIFYSLLSLINEKYAANIIGDFGSNLDPFLYRGSLFELVWENVKDNKWIGHGVKTKIEILENYTSIDNAYLAYLSQLGILGLCGMVFYYLYYLLYSVKKSVDKKNSFNKFFIVTFICYLIVLFTVASMSEFKMMLFLIILMVASNKMTDYKNG